MCTQKKVNMLNSLSVCRWIKNHYSVVALFNRDKKVEVNDTTKLNSSNAAGPDKIYYI